MNHICGHIALRDISDKINVHLTLLHFDKFLHVLQLRSNIFLHYLLPDRHISICFYKCTYFLVFVYFIRLLTMSFRSSVMIRDDAKTCSS